MKWLYRLESTTTENGLWYNDKGEYVWGCKGCSGDTKYYPMGYDERYRADGKSWYSSCSNKEDLLHWFSLEDFNYLIENGFVFLRYLATDYTEYPKETVFIKETALKREEIDINSLFGNER